MIFCHAPDTAAILGLPNSRVRMIAPALGGGFGGKNDTTIEPHVGLLAMKTRKPVRWAWTTEEEFTTSSCRHPYIMVHKLGMMKDGTFVAKQITDISDCGAYTQWGLYQVDKHAFVGGRGPYRTPNYRCDTYLVYTNKQPGSAMRGFGVNQAAFATESQIDIAAEDLGIDPLEIRLKNALRDGDTPATKQTMDAVGEVPVLDKLKELSNWQAKDWASAEGGGEVKKKGRGISATMYSTGICMAMNPCAAFVQVKEDGSVIIQTGAAEIGQGSNTVLAQIGAEELGVNLEDITVIPPTPKQPLTTSVASPAGSPSSAATPSSTR